MFIVEKNRRRGLSDKQVGVLLIIPGLAIFMTIILFPFIDAIRMSFTDKTMINPETHFVGFQNYAEVFGDPYFLKTMGTTVLFVIGATALPFILGLVWAILLNQRFRGAQFMRGVTLINWIIPGTAIGFLWSWIFNAQYGVLNGMLQKLGGAGNTAWLGQTSTALLCVVIARTWQMLPWYMAFLLGGLQGVSLDQIEAARMDGAGNWKCFTNVVVPSMKNIIVLILVMGVVGNLQHFDLPWTMVQGGPARATTTLSIEVYATAFKNWSMGKAATVGTIWAVFLACFSFVYLRQVKDTD